MLKIFINNIVKLPDNFLGVKFEIVSNKNVLDVLQDKDISCFIIEDFDLVPMIRRINHDIPIFMVIDSLDFSCPFDLFSTVDEFIVNDFPLLLQARILRRIKVYRGQLSEQEKQFDELLRKSLNDELDEADNQLLEDLQLKRNSAILASELGELEVLDNTIKGYKKLLNTLKTEPLLYQVEREEPDSSRLFSHVYTEPEIYTELQDATNAAKDLIGEYNLGRIYVSEKVLMGNNYVNKSKIEIWSSVS